MSSLAPAPLTPRQEKFCREYVHCANGSGAASKAGYARRTSRQQAYRLLRQPRILARIRHMQAEVARECASERSVLLSKLESVYRRAMRDHHFYAAARAVELQARIAGLDAGRPLNAAAREQSQDQEKDQGKAPPAAAGLILGRHPAEWGHGVNPAEAADGPQG